MTTVAVAAPWILLLAGCASTSVQQRDLGNTGDVTTCVPVGDGKTIFMGVHPLANSDGVAEIDRVYLADPYGMELVNAYLVPVSGLGAGAVTRNPMRAEAWDWGQAIPAVGAQVDAQSPPYTLVVEVRRTADEGSAEDVKAEYRIGSRQYYSAWTHSITLVKKECP